MLQLPPKNCPLCPRLVAFREENQTKFPAYWNAPVPSFGELSAELLIIGLAPGLHGANQTGRPFTGDYAGFTLYESLQKSGFAKGNYFATLPDTLDSRMGSAGAVNGQGEFHLINCRISNAVRCVPQENKPEPSEINTCNQFLQNEIAAMPNLKMILSLGLVSHNAVLKALGYKAAHGKFSHGAQHQLGNITLVDSYHCSRYNINTGRLTQEMFDAVVETIAVKLKLIAEDPTA